MFYHLLPQCDRDELMKKLKEKGIETRPFFYLIDKMPPHKSNEKFPVAKELSSSGINLPSGVLLKSNNINKICETIGSLC